MGERGSRKGVPAATGAHGAGRAGGSALLESPPLRIELLGAFAVTLGSRRVPEDAWRLRKAKSLVKLLALATGHRLHREQVMELLWPDLEADAAGNNLRKVLHTVRRALDPAGLAGPLLQLHEDLIALAPAGPLWIDADAFAQAAAHASRTLELPAYRAALALYGGDLLPEDPYEDWVLRRREELRVIYVTLLVQAARLYEARGEFDSAIEALQRALVQDPLQEPAHAGLMRLYALTGARPRALRQYQQLQERLRRDLDVEPTAASQQLYADIAAGRVGPAAVPAAPAATDALASRRDQLPTPLTSFIGRERELRAARQLLAGTRMLTLTGAGGCGKTRLALEVAREVGAEFVDGVWWVELAALVDPALVPHAAATATGIHEEPGRALADTLVDWLRDRQTLLVLDNCEHLVAACAQLALALLQACPHFHLLATSREALNIPGEVTLVVPSLSTPDPAAIVAPDGEPVALLLQSEAGRLLVDRARAVQPGFRLTKENAAAVAQICRRLDGIPLAIELAAARIKVMAPEQVAARLAGSFRFLTSGSRTALPRHQTLRATIDWSHDLLGPAERALFRRLAIFAGDFSLAAAEQICAGARVAEHEVLDLLAHLIDKSLVRVVVETAAHSVRYRLLEMLRQYGHERLLESGEADATASRHTAYYLALAQRAEPELRGPWQIAWFARLDQEHDNLRAALDWCRLHDVQTGLHIAGSLWWFLDVRGHHAEGRRRLAELLALDPVPTGARATALNCAGALALRQGDAPSARPLLTESLAIFRALGDRLGEAGALERFGLLLYFVGDYVGSRPVLEDSLAGFRACGYKPGIGWTLGALAMLARLDADYDRARGCLEEGLAHLRDAGDQRGLVYTLNSLGQLLRVDGNYPRARVLLGESLAVARELGDKPFVGWALHCLGDLARRQGDLAQARGWLVEGLRILSMIGHARHIAQGLCLLGVLAVQEGAYERGTRLIGAAAARHPALRASLDADERAAWDASLAAARAALGEAAFLQAQADGDGLTGEQAIACALTPPSSAQ